MRRNVGVLQQWLILYMENEFFFFFSSRRIQNGYYDGNLNRKKMKLLFEIPNFINATDHIMNNCGANAALIY